MLVKDIEDLSFCRSLPNSKSSIKYISIMCHNGAGSVYHLKNTSRALLRQWSLGYLSCSTHLHDLVDWLPVVWLVREIDGVPVL
jgi:hypothetical protein